MLQDAESIHNGALMILNIEAPRSYYVRKAESAGDARRNGHKHTETGNFNHSGKDRSSTQR